MRNINWNQTTCQGLKERLRRYCEVVNFYFSYLERTDRWSAPDRFEKYIEPLQAEIYAYVESLGFTKEEAEGLFPASYEPMTSQSLFEKYARNLSSVIYKGEQK